MLIIRNLPLVRSHCHQSARTPGAFARSCCWSAIRVCISSVCRAARKKTSNAEHRTPNVELQTGPFEFGVRRSALGVRRCPPPVFSLELPITPRLLQVPSLFLVHRKRDIIDL